MLRLWLVQSDGSLRDKSGCHSTRSSHGLKRTESAEPKNKVWRCLADVPARLKEHAPSKTPDVLAEYGRELFWGGAVQGVVELTEEQPISQSCLFREGMFLKAFSLVDRNAWQGQCLAKLVDLAQTSKGYVHLISSMNNF